MKKKYTEEDIQALTAKEHIGLRPDLYFETCFAEKSLDSLPFEVLCHAFDEYFEGHCTEIKLQVTKRSFSLEYNAGMPLSLMNDHLTKAEVIMTKISACSNLKKHLEVGQAYCRLGMATINFASEICRVTTIWNNQKGVFEFKNGETIAKSIAAIEKESERTTIYMLPNPLLFRSLIFSTEGIRKKADAIKLNLEGLNITVEENMAHDLL